MIIFAPMAEQIYYPFQSFKASKKLCFLTGKPLNSSEEQIHVFPQWLMSRYKLEDQPFKLLDESIQTYKDLKLPCSAEANELYVEPLERDIEAAFTIGYEAVKELDELRLFQWAAKWLHGIIFNELQAAMRQQNAEGEEFSVSQSILQRFTNLHVMLQTLSLPIKFDEFKPYSLFLFKVNNLENEFGYRDEVSTVTFALRINDFGLIINLQDNGTIGRYLQETYDKIKDRTLHPIQFEEFSARAFYAAYLFNRLPNYDIMPVGDDIFIEANQLRGNSTKPLFDEWQVRTYGQVLESFWKKWGYLLLEIIKDPDNPVSHLFDADGNFIPADSIDLGL
ncbi:hypothetical protein [Mucilaginibacter polytrichastri]|uniref:Uncharacterized protein n=1 Tax=Mucilaginibacter polytrichastri TaxID=1302689 RepID=A0A1Q6A5W3_9SPHI|nr:hypothetical protein [Mucilaginibacter polytrichastri]OKS89372.1 hypothetical protein RG47T_4856 [Mucilaginibacter polytrichastri]SFS73681.1 hypothetical protein SAMN04487890_103235 [Mucilaginibacter polytrichastri]